MASGQRPCTPTSPLHGCSRGGGTPRDDADFELLAPAFREDEPSRDETIVEVATPLPRAPSSGRASGWARWKGARGAGRPRPRPVHAPQKAQLSNIQPNVDCGQKPPERFYSGTWSSTASTRASTALSSRFAPTTVTGSVCTGPLQICRRFVGTSSVPVDENYSALPRNELPKGGPRAWSAEPSPSICATWPVAGSGKPPSTKYLRDKSRSLGADTNKKANAGGERAATVLGVRRELVWSDEAQQEDDEVADLPPSEAMLLAGNGNNASSGNVWQGTEPPETPRPESEFSYFTARNCSRSISMTPPNAQLPTRKPAAIDSVGKCEEVPSAKAVIAARAEVLSQLATPRKRGLSERAKKRALSRTYEAFARRAAATLVPAAQKPDGASTFGDVWHTAGEDGYRSAVFHAAVRCRELLQEEGRLMDVIEGSDGPESVVFGGHGTADATGAPEITRLRTACFLFEEICKVSSPLQDTLRFLFRELCRCIFEGFTFGADILLLTPFFASSLGSVAELAEQRRRVVVAERECTERDCNIQELQAAMSTLQTALDTQLQKEKTQNETLETLLSERNELRIRLARLEQSHEIRGEELRALGSDLAHVQGKAFTANQDLEITKNKLSAMSTYTKDMQNNMTSLQNRASDLQMALRLAIDGDSHDIKGMLNSSELAYHVEDSKKPEAQSMKSSPEVQQELALQHRRTRCGAAVQQCQAQVIDGRRLLKLALPDGSTQLVMRAVSEDERGIQRIAGTRHGGIVLMASGEAFGALAVGQALPEPPDLLQFKATEDEEVVREVQREVLSLVNDYASLLDLFRRQRREIKSTLRLVPDWNRDELRGIMQSVLSLDADESILVPSPVPGAKAIVGLGEGLEVPAFLRYDGVLRAHTLSWEEAAGMYTAVWLDRTRCFVEAESHTTNLATLEEDIAEHYLPTLGSTRTAQMENMYNLMIALRQRTTLSNHEVVATTTSSPSSPNVHAMPASIRRGGGANGSINTSEVEAAAVVAANADNDAASPSSQTLASQAKQVVMRTRMLLAPTVDFRADAEVLYRGLLGEFHEDSFHDQTAMLIALCHALAFLGERLTPAHWAPKEAPPLTEPPFVIGLAELSAVLRLFFPSKPREYLSCLKRLAFDMAFEVGSIDDASQQKGSVKCCGPLVVNVCQIFGAPMRRGNLTESQALLESLILRPTAFVLELRRQHLVECMMFVDLLQKALRSTAPKSLQPVSLASGTCRPFATATTAPSAPDTNTASVAGATTGTTATSDSLSPHVNVKQAESALLEADHALTADQLRVYTLRGFGRRLPDSHPLSVDYDEHDQPVSPTAADARSSVQRRRTTIIPSVANRDGPEKNVYSKRVETTRRLLRDRVSQLSEEGANVPTDVFVRRLMASGVVKAGNLWKPDIGIADVVHEAGLVAARPSSAAAPLEDLLSECSSQDGDATVGATVSLSACSRSTATVAQAQAHDFPDPAEKYYAHGQAGWDIQELSVGYPAVALTYWLAGPD